MLFQYLFPFASSIVLTLLGVLFALKFFPKWGLMDKPRKYGLKRKPIPYFGGIIIFLSFFVNALIFFPIDKYLIGLLLGSLLLVVVCFLDDKYGLSPYFRFFVQVLCVLILILAGIGITHITNPLGGEIRLDLFQIPFRIDGINYHFTLLADLFTLIWVIGMINTMNWLDGLNGLPSGIATIGSFTLFFLSISDRVNQPEIAILAVILGGVCLTFWFFDFHPAKILMGDTGSMFLGFVLGTLAIFSGGKVATAFLVMGFPILDAIWVVLRRIINGQSPFKGDLLHFHHRLLEAGLSHRKALLLIYVLCGVFGITALFLNTWWKFIAMVLMFLVMVGIGYGVVRMKKLKAD